MSNELHPYQAGKGTAQTGSRCGSWLAPLLLVAAMGVGAPLAFAQSLNWEGQTGIFVTPLAYTAPSSAKGFGAPVVAYHYLDGGGVIGGFHQASITIGGFNRIELGYTRDLHQEGSNSQFSGLWSSGFNVFHGKLNLLSEKDTKQGWLPSLSVGFVARSQIRNVDGVLQKKDTSNADFYIVATKSVTQIRKAPLVLNLGFKATNASLLGLAGNSPTYKGRVFGAAAFVLKGPARSTLVVGSEIMQEPREIQGLAGAVVPTTITYAIRVVPSGSFFSGRGWDAERPKFTFDFGVAQAAGSILPGVNLNARHQFALGISYAL
jgi:Protein of unknown function (DUF3034)